MGRPKLDAAKVAVTLRLDPDVLAAYKAKGSLWRERMGEALAAGLVEKAVTWAAGDVATPVETAGKSPANAPKPKPDKAVEVAGVQFGPVTAAPGSRLKSKGAEATRRK